MEEPTTSHDLNPLPRWIRPIESLRYRDFRLLWSVAFFSSAARNLQQISLGWLAFDLTGEAILLASVMLAYQLPFLVSSPVVGVLVDRLDRRKLLLWSQSTMAIIAILLVLDIYTGAVRPWHLFIFAFLSGTENTIIHIIRQALVPRVVPPKSLLNAVSLTGSAFNFTRVLAPLVGGFLIVTIGVTGNFALQACLLLVVAVAALPMHVGKENVRQSEGSGFSRLTQDIGEGLNYIWKFGNLKTLMIVNFITQFLGMSLIDMLPVWADQVLDVGATSLAQLYSASGIGALIGVLVLGFAASEIRRPGKALMLVAILLSLAIIVFSRTDTVPESLICLAFIGSLQVMFFALASTLIQRQIPQGLQGRVMAIYNMGHVFMALGGVTIGLITKATDIQFALLVMGTGMMVFAVSLTRIKSLGDS